MLNINRGLKIMYLLDFLPMMGAFDGILILSMDAQAGTSHAGPSSGQESSGSGGWIRTPDNSTGHNLPTDINEGTPAQQHQGAGPSNPGPRESNSPWNSFPSVPSDLPALPADSIPSVPSLPSIASDVEVEQPAPIQPRDDTNDPSYRSARRIIIDYFKSNMDMDFDRTPSSNLKEKDEKL